MASRKEMPRQVLVPPNIRDPSLQTSVPTTSKTPSSKPMVERSQQSWQCRLYRYFYNRENKTFCDRSFHRWCVIIAYAFIYVIFLCAYMLIILYGSLLMMKHVRKYQNIPKDELMTYSEQGIGLSATPTSDSSYPLIWYKQNDVSEYGKYVNAIDKLMMRKRLKKQINNTDLGPCGIPPYGYGDKPCIIIRINKQRMWKGIPLQRNSSKAKDAPAEVQKWLISDQKLWLLCNGYHSYDKEHIGNIKYFPDPPGFDPKMFPLDMQSSSPYIGIQILDFTLGISLAIQCKLWYENGPSTVEFMLYVAPGGNSSNKTVGTKE